LENQNINLLLYQILHYNVSECRTRCECKVQCFARAGMQETNEAHQKIAMNTINHPIRIGSARCSQYSYNGKIGDM